ncbi:hypothetical protein PAPHI01_1280 [Pancytospora philotis]|nr:hypothetical protein PAPHI01_1280 [Pancytospora philotis]
MNYTQHRPDMLSLTNLLCSIAAAAVEPANASRESTETEQPTLSSTGTCGKTKYEGVHVDSKNIIYFSKDGRGKQPRRASSPRAHCPEISQPCYKIAVDPTGTPASYFTNLAEAVYESMMADCGSWSADMLDGVYLCDDPSFCHWITVVCSVMAKRGFDPLLASGRHSYSLKMPSGETVLLSRSRAEYADMIREFARDAGCRQRLRASMEAGAYYSALGHDAQKCFRYLLFFRGMRALNRRLACEGAKEGLSHADSRCLISRNILLILFDSIVKFGTKLRVVRDSLIYSLVLCQPIKIRLDGGWWSTSLSLALDFYSDSASISRKRGPSKDSLLDRVCSIVSSSVPYQIHHEITALRLTTRRAGSREQRTVAVYNDGDSEQLELSLEGRWRQNLSRPRAGSPGGLVVVASIPAFNF